MINTIKNDERIIFALRSLYGSFGYGRYKMGKFEEYDLYVRNKDFLISDSVITFTDTNGRLMALKPDVTLSIVKNSRDIPGCVQKVYYNENVYRVSKGANSFREITQVGLECIGDIDSYSILEVLELAARSLKAISENCVLNLSQLDVLTELLSGADAAGRDAIISCIREKNAHELSRACEAAGIGECAAKLAALVKLCGAPEDVLPQLKKILGESRALAELEAIAAAFDPALKDMLRIDFSVVSDLNYYNGVVFKGFIEGVPAGVLSGGRYDKLMARMGRKSGAIGFAVYMDQLERLQQSGRAYDADVLLIYGADADLAGLRDAVRSLQAGGKSVIAQRCIPDKFRYRQLAEYRNGEVVIREDA